MALLHGYYIVGKGMKGGMKGREKELEYGTIMINIRKGLETQTYNDIKVYLKNNDTSKNKNHLCKQHLFRGSVPSGTCNG